LSGQQSGAQSLLETAVRAGSNVCFANPGTTEMPLVAALDATPGMRAVLGLFEGVCSGAADGYARMTGRPALTLLHLGPGFANAIANLHNARRAHSPVVNLIGDHASWHLAYDAPLTSDIESLARPVSLWVHTTQSADSMAADGARAIVQATCGAGGAGGVASLILPADYQAQPASGPAEPEIPAQPPPAAPSELESVAERLRSARAPAILLGAGALRAGALREAARIAAVCGARLVTEVFAARWERGRGLPCPERLPYLPEQAIEFLAPHDTLVLAGARAPVAFFGYEGIPSELAPPEAVVLAFGAEHDAEASLRAIADALGAAAYQAPADAALPDRPQGALSPSSAGALLARALPENAIVVDEAATSGLPFVLMSSGAPRHDMLALTGGAIGQGLPCATGAAIACPERKVIAYQADGSAAYTLQALWTQAREGLDVVTLLCSNRAYRILQIELGRAGIAEPGPKARALTNLDAPTLDWCSLARGFGVPAERVEDCDALETALARVFAEPGPAFLELVL
jgi:acetolactate synthase-1/2/3 large subunit